MILDTTGIAFAQRALGGQTAEVRFLRPVISTILACSRLHLRRAPSVSFVAKDAAEYATHSGLSLALAGDYDAMVRPRGHYEGLTWSHLTTLYQHVEIEACNKTINDLLFAQLTALPPKVVDAIARIIGELHDNVASHSNGRGFSSAQFYPGHRGHLDCLEVSVADVGWGFLRMVHRIIPDIQTDAEAIKWCLQKGNTTWRPSISPGDLHEFPYPYAEPVGHSGQADHHMGWGLWLLSELVRTTHSTLWIWSGNASFTLSEDGSEKMETTPIKWPGVLIDLTVYPDKASLVDFAPMTAKLGKLAEELGL